jgi:hypothetical protein
MLGQHTAAYVSIRMYADADYCSIIRKCEHIFKCLYLYFILGGGGREEGEEGKEEEEGQGARRRRLA